MYYDGYGGKIIDFDDHLMIPAELQPPAPLWLIVIAARNTPVVHGAGIPSAADQAS